MLLLITERGAPKVSQEDDLPPRRQLEPWSQIKRSPPRSGGGRGLGSPSLIPPQIHTNMSDGLVRAGRFLHTRIHSNLAVLTARRSALNSPRKCGKKNLLSSAGSRAAPPSVKEFVGVLPQTCCRGGSVSPRAGPQPCFHSLPRLISKQGSRRRLLVSRMKVFATSDAFDPRKNNR